MPDTRRGLHFEDVVVGARFTTGGRTVTEADVAAFAGVSGDFGPLHTDAVFMKRHPFGERVAHGLLGAAIATGLASRLGLFEGTTVALVEQRLRYEAPLRLGATVHLEIEILDKRETGRADRGLVTTRCDLLDEHDTTLIAGEWSRLVLRRPSPPPETGTSKEHAP